MEENQCNQLECTGQVRMDFIDNIGKEKFNWFSFAYYFMTFYCGQKYCHDRIGILTCAPAKRIFFVF